MLNSGDRSLEDTRQIKADEGLKEILPLERIPSSDAFGDWLRSMGINAGLYGLKRLLKRGMKPVESPSALSSVPKGSEPNGLQVERYDRIKGYTLDIDATRIVAEKQSAKMTYPPASAEPRAGHFASTLNKHNNVFYRHLLFTSLLRKKGFTFL